MKKRLLAVLLAVAVLLTCAPLGAIPEVAALTSGYLTYIVVNGGVTITDCDPSVSGAIAIPDTLDGYPVVEIGYEAFRDCKSLTSVTIPASVTSMGREAFNNCVGLTSVFITDVAAWCGIEFYSFTANPLCYAGYLYLYDELVTDLILPDGVTRIGNFAFFGCDTLTSVTIPASVTSMGDWAFEGCNSLTSVHITDLAAWCAIDFGTVAESNPLYYAEGLYLDGELVTNLTIPDGVTRVGNFAFAGCSDLTFVSIPESVTDIGQGAFYSCDSLAAVTIPGSVTAIGNRAFEGCGSLATVTIREGVDSIGEYAFQDCSNLTSITIPSSITGIGWWAFEGCDDLHSVHITDLAAWCSIDFSYDRANPLYNAGNLYFNGRLVTNLILPDDVSAIGAYAFFGCSSLIAVTIPNNVTGIGDHAFSECSMLDTVYYLGKKTEWERISIDFENDDLTSATIHYGEWITETPPACTKAGSRTFYCTECQTSFIESLSAQGHTWQGGICANCDENGKDIDKDGVLSSEDAIYLLYHTLLPEQHPIRWGDADGSGVVDSADAVLLLYHILVPDSFSLI